jgi:hypothetical protein
MTSTGLTVGCLVLMLPSLDGALCWNSRVHLDAIEPIRRCCAVPAAGARSIIPILSSIPVARKSPDNRYVSSREASLSVSANAVHFLIARARRHGPRAAKTREPLDLLGIALFHPLIQEAARLRHPFVLTPIARHAEGHPPTLNPSAGLRRAALGGIAPAARRPTVEMRD